MEYVNERGDYPDVPVDQIRETFEREYPRMLGGKEAGLEAADFAADVDAERSKAQGSS